MPCITVCNTTAPLPHSVPRCPSVAPAPMPSKDPYIFEKFRQNWSKWDLRILILYILFTQLYLLVFGRRRRKSSPSMFQGLSVWLLYLFAELLATIALGKLSNVEKDEMEKNKLRGLWAPIILFYLGGPDTITVLQSEENPLWVRHLIGLFTQGIRTANVLWVTWTTSCLSVLALVMLLSGLIKYAERVWVIRSRVQENYEGFVKLDDTEIKSLNQVLNTTTSSTTITANRKTSSTTTAANRKTVLQAYSYFQILKPHKSNYSCDKRKLEKLIEDFKKWVGSPSDQSPSQIEITFKLIEIELGFVYDVIFSKVDTIFTIWGCIIRFISFSCTVSVLVGFFFVEKPDGHWKGDVPITIILLLGAIFIEIAGIFVQLVSDWAMVWACKIKYLSESPSQHQSKVLSTLVTPIFRLHELLISKSQRWSESMGQFNLLNYWLSEDKPTKFKEMMKALCGEEKRLNKKFGSQVSKVKLIRMKELIFNQLKKASEVKPSNTPTMKIGERTLEQYKDLLTQTQYDDLKKSIGSIELDFNESIVIWHIATDVCSQEVVNTSNSVILEATKILSHYMMYVLVICPSRLPICNEIYKIKKLKAVKDFFKQKEACKLLLEQQCNSRNVTIKKIHKLVHGLMEIKENKWVIMRNVWVEMLCHAASECPVKNHLEELRNGGQFLTHVWLLLMHFGVTKRLEEDESEDEEAPKDVEATAATGADKGTGTCNDVLQCCYR